MTIRTKIWLIAVSVAVTVCVASWGRMFLTRNRIIREAQTAPRSWRTTSPRI